MKKRSAEGVVLKMVAELRREISEGDLTLGEIFDILKVSGHNLLILFMCLPFLQPIPLLGLSTPLGFLIALATIQRARGRKPWIPEKWRNRDFAGPVMIKTLDLAEKVLKRFAGLLHPRWKAWVTSKGVIVSNAVVVVTCAFLLSLPLPVPFSNTVPTIVIVVSSLGQLEEDGLWILLSYVLFGGCLAAFAGLALGVIKGIGLLGG